MLSLFLSQNPDTRRSFIHSALPVTQPNALPSALACVLLPPTPNPSASPLPDVLSQSTLKFFTVLITMCNYVFVGLLDECLFSQQTKFCVDRNCLFGAQFYTQHTAWCLEYSRKMSKQVNEHKLKSAHLCTDLNQVKQSERKDCKKYV